MLEYLNMQFRRSCVNGAAILFFAVLLPVLIGLVFYYRYTSLSKDYREVTLDNQTLRQTVGKYTREISSLKEEISKKDALIETHKTLISTLNKGNKELKQKYSGLMNAVQEAAKSVEVFKKKADADKMLLAKYSKIFFLNENYEPLHLRYIDSDFVKPGRNLKIKSEVYPFLIAMFRDMKEQGLNPQVVSAYRSFSQQKSLKGAYLRTYGSGANKFSADQGYSEHQLGTTVDIVNADTGLSIDFEKSDEFKWLQDNAYKYGFILSYPKGNRYYIYEPWHWRFVGKNLSKYLHNEGKFFYQLPQNQIYNYLINIFDNPPDN